MAHVPVLVHFDVERYGPMAEVCMACTDIEAGVWVPAPFCPQAAALMAPYWEDPYGFYAGLYTVPWAASIWDEPAPEDPLDRWDRYDPVDPGTD